MELDGSERAGWSGLERHEAGGGASAASQGEARTMGRRRPSGVRLLAPAARPQSGPGCPFRHRRRRPGPARSLRLCYSIARRPPPSPPPPPLLASAPTNQLAHRSSRTVKPQRSRSA
ncbi:hypothetical protein R5R35_005906 [Gryllus longicercus]|uniref:Uncharacterized protein n=1 Tax=Gryllus longicercus TaxID=2509291 RepID=A0AAN9Z1W3_9ORTH